jgi:hypothetical protein
MPVHGKGFGRRSLLGNGWFGGQAGEESGVDRAAVKLGQAEVAVEADAS